MSEPARKPLLHGVKRLQVASVAIMGSAVLWWGIVYAQVMNNTGFPLHRTLPCLLYTSDRCSLAMALCKGSHFLGIQRYSAEFLWSGAVLAAAALIAEGLIGRARSLQEKQP